MLTLEIKVTPSAGRQGFSIDKSGMLKCALKSAPENNKANLELITLLAKALGIPKDTVRIITGQTSRKKRVTIATLLTHTQVLSKLGIEDAPLSMDWARPRR